MNFGKSRRPIAQTGNAMVYVLLALALLAALTMSVMRGNNQGGDDISADQVEFQVTEILAYAAATQSVVDQMIMSGTDPASILFTLPSATSFDTGTHGVKLFHPSGGGLNYRPAKIPPFVTSVTAPEEGWYIGRFNNVGWTPTAGQDLILTAHGIEKLVCENINKKITGSKAIPAIDIADARQYLIDSVNYGGGAQLNFMASSCSNCNGIPSLCISNSGGTVWDFYTIIVGR